MINLIINYFIIIYNYIILYIYIMRSRSRNRNNRSYDIDMKSVDRDISMERKHDSDSRFMLVQCTKENKILKQSLKSLIKMKKAFDLQKDEIKNYKNIIQSLKKEMKSSTGENKKEYKRIRREK